MGNYPQNVIDAAIAAEKAYYPYGPFVSVSLAQWALESAYGRAEPAGSNNPFGIKANQSQIAAHDDVIAMTHETLHGVYVALPQFFAKYENVEEAFLAHAKLLATAPCYHAAQAAQTPDEYAMALQGIYATGIPGHPYGNALIAIMKGADLYQYDVKH
jgi:flagellum-specific peptidoglycan hydrolase FlgJ